MPRPQNPCMDRPQGHWWTDVTSWDLNLHVGSPHGFKPAADEPLADGRNLSIPARSSVSSSRPLSVQLCRCTTAVILGAPWGKMVPPYDNCILRICGAPWVWKNVVFKAGSWLKMSVFESGTTVLYNAPEWYYLLKIAPIIYTVCVSVPGIYFACTVEDAPWPIRMGNERAQVEQTKRDKYIK